MTVVHCPCCRDEVTVPAKASPRALVRCPLCLEEYRLSEALAELPPALIVVDGSVAADEPALVGAAVEDAEAGTEYQMAGGFGPSPALGAGAGGVFDASPSAEPIAAPALLKGKIRPKKKEKSVVLEMAKVVIGGAVGLIMGLGVLWWVFGKDPLDLGPQVSPYAPWVVPAKFHKKEKLSTNDRTANHQTPTGPAAQATGTGQGLKVDPNLQAALDPTFGGNAKPMNEPLIGALDPLGNPLSLSPTTPDLSLDPTPKPQPTTPSPEPVSLPAPEPAPAPAPEPAPPAAAPIPGPPDFTKAVLAVSEALEKVNDSASQPADVRRQLFTDMYLAASDMGRPISYLSPSDPDLFESVQTMQTFLGALISTGKVAAMKSLTDIVLPQRKHEEGVFLAGTVADIREVGALFECVVHAGKSGMPIAILCANNPHDFCKVGDELLVVGRLIDVPQKNLPGYEGQAEKLIYYGYHAVVPKAGSE